MGNLAGRTLGGDLATPIARGFDELLEAFSQQAHLPVRVLAVCRSRLAQLHGADVSLHAMNLEPQVEKMLIDAPDTVTLNDAESACIAFTEVYAMDAQAITDDLADAVKYHFGDAGLVTLIEALGVFDGLVRLSLLWQEGDS